MPNKISVLNTNFNDFGKIESGGDQLFLPSYEDAAKQNTELPPDVFKQQYDLVEGQYNSYLLGKYMSYVNSPLNTSSATLNQQLGSLGSGLGQSERPVAYNEPVFVDRYNEALPDENPYLKYYQNGFYVDKYGKRKPMGEAPPEGMFTYENDMDGTPVLKEHDWNDSLGDKEIASIFGPPAAYSSYFGSMLRGFWNSGVANIPSALVGTPIVVGTNLVSDLIDSLDGNDKPGELADWAKQFKAFGYGIQNKSDQYSVKNLADTADSPWSNWNTALYAISAGLASVAQVMAASKLVGGIASLKTNRIELIKKLSMNSGLGIGSVMMGDAFFKQAKRQGINEDDASKMYLPMALITMWSESKFGPNMFANSFMSKTGQVEFEKMVEEPLKKALTQAGVKFGATLTAQERNAVTKEVSTNIITKLSEKFKNIKSPALTGFMEEGTEEAFEQLLQNGTEMAYDQYKQATTTNSQLSKDHGLFGVDGITDGVFDNFLLGAISGGIAGGLMGKHQNAKIASLWADGKENIAHQTVDTMHKEGRLASTYHGIDGKPLKEGSTEPSLNDVAYKSLKTQFAAYDVLKKTFNLTDADELELIGGKESASTILNIAMQKHDLQEKLKGINTQINELNNAGGKDAEVANLKQQAVAIESFVKGMDDQINYFQSGQYVKDKKVDGLIYTTPNLNSKFKGITGQNINSGHVHDYYKMMDEYLVHEQQQVEKAHEDLGKWNNLDDKAGPTTRKDVLEKLKEINPEDFSAEADKTFQQLLNKIDSFGADQEEESALVAKTKEIFGAYTEQQKSETSSSFITVNKAGQEGADFEQRRQKGILLNQRVDEALKSKPARSLIFDKVAAINRFQLLAKENFLRSVPNSEGVIQTADVSQYRTIEQLLDELENDSDNNSLDTVENQEKLYNIRKSIGYATMMAEMNDNIFNKLETSDYVPDNLSVLKPTDLPLSKIVADEIKERIEVADQRLQKINENLKAEQSDRKKRQGRIRKNHILVSVKFISLLKGAIAANTSKELQKEFDARVAELEELVFKVKADKDNLVDTIPEESWNLIEPKLVQVQDILNSIFNEKAFKFETMIQAIAYGTLGDKSSNYRSSPIDEFKGNDLLNVIGYNTFNEEFAKGTNVVRDVAVRKAFANYFVNEMATIKRLKPSVFAAYLKQAVGSEEIPGFEQERAIKHMVSFYAGEPMDFIGEGGTGFIKNGLGLRGYGGAGKTSFATKHSLDIIKLMNPNAVIYGVAPSRAVADSLASTGGIQSVDTRTFLADIEARPGIYDHMTVLVFDEVHALTQAERIKLATFLSTRPAIKSFFLYDLSQALNTTGSPTLYRDDSVFNLFESTLPLTEVYRSGINDIWKIQNYYRQISYKKNVSEYDAPPMVNFNDVEHMGVQAFGERSQLIQNFINYARNNSNGYFLVYSQAEYDALTDKTKGTGILHDFKNNVKVILPSEQSFGVGGSEYGLVWVDSSGAPDVIRNAVNLVGVSRGKQFVGIFDPTMVRYSTKGAVLEISKDPEIVKENAKAFSDRMTAILNLNTAVVPEPAQQVKTTPPPAEEKKGKKKSVRQVLTEVLNETGEEFENPSSRILNTTIALTEPLKISTEDGGITYPVGSIITITKVYTSKKHPFVDTVEINGVPLHFVPFDSIKGNSMQRMPHEEDIDDDIQSLEQDFRVQYSSAKEFNKSKSIPILVSASPVTMDDFGASTLNKLRIALLRFIETRGTSTALKYTYHKSLMALTDTGTNTSEGVISAGVYKTVFDEFIQSIDPKKVGRGSLFSQSEYDLLIRTMNNNYHPSVFNWIGALPLPELWDKKKGDYYSVTHDQISSMSEAEYLSELKRTLPKKLNNNAPNDVVNQVYYDNIIKYQLQKFRLFKYANKVASNSPGQNSVELFAGDTGAIANTTSAGYIVGGTVKYERNVASRNGYSGRWTMNEFIASLQERIDGKILTIGEPQVRARGNNSFGQKLVLPVTYMNAGTMSEIYVDLITPLVTDDNYISEVIVKELDTIGKKYGNLTKEANSVQWNNFYIAFKQSIAYDTLLNNKAVLKDKNTNDVIDKLKSLLFLKEDNGKIFVNENKDGISLTSQALVARLKEVYAIIEKEKIPVHQRFQKITKGQTVNALFDEGVKSRLRTNAIDIHFPKVSGRINLIDENLSPVQNGQAAAAGVVVKQEEPSATPGATRVDAPVVKRGRDSGVGHGPVTGKPKTKTFNLQEERTNIEDARAILLKILGEKAVGDMVSTGRIRLFDKLYHDGALVYGLMKGGLISLEDSGGINKGAARHEAFHFIFTYLLGENERKTILNDIKNRMVEGTDGSALNITDIEAEEWAARQYETFEDNRKGIVGRIKQFFSWIKNTLIPNWMANKDRLGELFADIEAGKYADRDLPSFEGEDVSEEPGKPKKKYDPNMDRPIDYGDYHELIRYFGDIDIVNQVYHRVARDLMGNSSYNRDISMRKRSFVDAIQQTQRNYLSLRTPNDEDQSKWSCYIDVPGLPVIRDIRDIPGHLFTNDILTSHECELYEDFQLGKPQVFWRFVKKVFPLLDLDGLMEAVRREDVNEFGESTLDAILGYSTDAAWEDSTIFKDTTKSLSDTVYLAIGSLNKMKQNGDQTENNDIVSMALLNTKLIYAASRARLDGGNFHEAFRRELVNAKIALGTEDEGESAINLTALLHELYADDNKYDFTAFNPDSEGDKNINISHWLQSIAERTPEEQEVVFASIFKHSADTGNSYLLYDIIKQLSHLEFIKNEQVIEAVVTGYENYSGDPEAAADFVQNLKEKIKSSHLLLAAVESHYASITSRTYARLTISKGSGKNKRFRLTRPTSNFVDDIQNGYSKSIDRTLFASFNGNPVANKKKKYELSSSAGRFSVTPTGIRSKGGRMLIHFHDIDGNTSFSLDDSVYDPTNNRFDTETISSLLKYIGISINKSALKMFFTDGTPEALRLLDKENKDIPANKRLAEIIGVLYMATASTYHENPTNTFPGTTNPYYDSLIRITNKKPLFADTVLDRFRDEEDESDADSEEEVASETAERKTVFLPSNMGWHLNFLAQAQSFSKSAGYRNVYYNVMGRKVYFDTQSSTFLDEIGHNTERDGNNDAMAMKFFRFGDSTSPYMVSDTEVNNPLYAVQGGFSNRTTLTVKNVSHLDGLIGLRAASYARATERDFFKSIMDVFTDSIVKNEGKTDFSAIIPWHTASDKTSQPIIEYNFGASKPLIFQDGKWSMNKKWIGDNAMNLFEYYRNIRIQGYTKWLNFFNEQKLAADQPVTPDIKLQEWHKDPAAFRNWLKAQSTALIKATGSKEAFAALVRGSDLKQNHHYKLSGDSVSIGRFEDPLARIKKEVVNGVTSEKEIPGYYTQENLVKIERITKEQESKGKSPDEALYHALWEILYKNSYFELKNYAFNQEYTHAFEADTTKKEIGIKKKDDDDTKEKQIGGSDVFIEAANMLFHFTDSYLSQAVLGSNSDFKNIQDYFKRSAGPIAPGWVPSTSNPNGLAETQNFAFVDHHKNNKMAFVQGIADGVERYEGWSLGNPITSVLTGRSFGPGVTPFPKHGMAKDVYHGVDANTGEGLYLKKAMLIPSAGMYKNSGYIQFMLSYMMNYDLPLATGGTVSYWKEFVKMYDGHNWEQTFETLADMVVANRHREQLVDQIVDVSSVKQGLSNVNLMPDYNSYNGEPIEALQTVKIQTKKLRYQLNAEKPIGGETVSVPTQIISEMAIGAHNKARVGVINKALANIVNATLKDIDTQIKYFTDQGMTETDAYSAYMRQIGLDNSETLGDVNQFVSLLKNNKISTELPFQKFKLLQFFVNKVNDGIKPQFAGLRASQSVGVIDIFEDKFGRAYTTASVESLTAKQKTALGITTVPRAQKHYEFLDGQTKGVEIVIPNILFEKFGIRVNFNPETNEEEQTIADFMVMEDGTSLETIGKPGLNNNAGDAFLRWLKPGSNLTNLNAYKAIMSVRAKRMKKLLDEQSKLNDPNEEGKDLTDYRAHIKYLIEQERAAAERPINEIDIANWYRKFENSLHVFVSKVPASNTASGFYGKVVGWINDTSNTIHIPSEKNVLDGSDYDIDQLNIYMLDEDSPDSSEPLKHMTGLKSRVTHALNTITGALLDYYQDPLNKEYFMMPLNLQQMRDMGVTGITPDEYKRYNDLMTNLQFRATAMEGKYMVGIFANTIKAYTLLFNASDHPEYFSPEFRLSRDGRVPSEDGKGQHIIEFLSKILNLAMDNAKELKLGEWNVNPETGNLLAMMAIRGEKPQDIINFLSNKHIRKYFKGVTNNSKSVNAGSFDKFDYLTETIDGAKKQLASITKEIEKNLIPFSKFFKTVNGLVLEVEVGSITDNQVTYTPLMYDRNNNPVQQQPITETLQEFMLTVSMKRNNHEDNTIESAMNKVAILGDSYMEDGVPKFTGLYKELIKAEQLFRFSTLLSINQGHDVKSFDLENYMEQFSFYTGQTLSEFIDKSNSSNWHNLRGKYLSVKAREAFEVRESAIRSTFDISKVMHTNVFYDSLVNSLQFVKRTMEKSFINESLVVKQAKADFLSMMAMDRWGYEKMYNTYHDELNNYFVSMYLDEVYAGSFNSDNQLASKNRSLPVLDGVEYDLTKPSERKLFMLHLPTWYERWRDNYKASTGKESPTFFNRIDIETTDYGDRLRFSRDWTYSDNAMNRFKREFASIDDADFKRNMYLYQLIKDGLSVRKGSLAEIFGEDLFEGYSAFLTRLNNNLHSDTDAEYRLSDGTIKTLPEILRNFNNSVLTNNRDLVPWQSTIENKIKKDIISMLPAYTKENVRISSDPRDFATRVQVYRIVPGKEISTDALRSDLQKYSGRKETRTKLSTNNYIPVDNEFDLDSNPYTPVKSGERSLDSDLLGVIKKYDLQTLDGLKEDGVYVMDNIAEGSFRSGIYLLQGQEVSVESSKKRTIISVRKNKKSALGGNRIGTSQGKVMVEVLRKAFPFVEVEWYSNKDRDNELSSVSGYVDGGIVYLNEDNLNSDTPIHEFAHLYQMVLKVSNPQLYQQLYELASQEKEILNVLKNNAAYKGLSDEELVDEAIATIIGWKGANVMSNNFTPGEKLNYWQRFKSAVSKVFDWLFGSVADSYKLKNSSLGSLSENSTFGDFVDIIIKDLTSGKQLSSLSSSAIAQLQSIKLLSAPMKVASDFAGLNELLYTGGQVVNKEQQAQNILSTLKGGPRINGNYNYNLLGKDITISGLDDATSLVDIKNKIVNTLQEHDEHLNNAIMNWGLQTGFNDASSPGLNLEVSRQISMKIGFDPMVDKMYQVGSSEFETYCKNNGLLDFYKELKTLYGTKSPLIILHNVFDDNKLKNLPIQISLFDFSAYTLRDKFQRSILSNFITEAQANSYKIQMKADPGHIRGMHMGFTAMLLKKYRPDWSVRAIEMVGVPQGRNHIETLRVNMFEFATQLKQMGKVSGFTDMLSGKLKELISDENLLKPEEWDSNYIGALYSFYHSQQALWDGDRNSSLLTITDSDVTFGKSMIQKYINGDSNPDDFMYMIEKRMKFVVRDLQDSNNRDALMRNKEFTFLSNILYQLKNKKTLGRNTMNQLSQIGYMIKGNHRASNDIVQWAYKEASNNIRWIIEQYKKFKKVHHDHLGVVMGNYGVLGGNQYAGYLKDDTQNLFRRLFKTKQMTDANGNTHEVNTGYIHFDKEDAETAQLLRDGKLLPSDLVYGRFVVDSIKKGMIQMIMHRQNSIAAPRGSDKEAEYLAQAEKIYQDTWKDGMVPIMEQKFTSKLASGKVGEAFNDFIQDYSKSDSIFEYMNTDWDSKFAVADKFGYQLTDSNYKDALGFSTSPETGETMLTDLEKNQNVDLNLERVLDYFVIAAIRKPRMDNVLMPKINAARSLLYNYNYAGGPTETHEQQKWLDFLDTMTDKIVFGKPHRLDDTLKAGGINVKIDNVFSTGRTFVSWSAVAGSVPTAINSLGTNFLQIFTNGLANIVDKRMFTAADAARAFAEFTTGADGGKFIKIIDKFQLVNMDEHSILNDRKHKKADKLLMQSDFFQLMNYGTDYLARGVCAVAQMIHDGSYAAYSVNEVGELVYDESKDNRFKGENGELIKQTIRKNLIDDGFMDKDDKLPQGYDWNEIRNLKTFSDSYIVGGMDSLTFRNMNYFTWAKVFSQFKNYLYDKAENLYAKGYQSETLGGYTVVKDAKGNKEVYWQKRMVEGKIQSLFAAYNALKSMNTKGLQEWNDLDIEQKKNIAKIGADLIVFISLYSMFHLLKGDWDKEKKKGVEFGGGEFGGGGAGGKWASYMDTGDDTYYNFFDRMGSTKFYKTLDYTIQDLVVDYKMPLAFGENPVPIVSYLMKGYNLTGAVWNADWERAGAQIPKMAPFGATYSFFSDLKEQLTKEKK